MLTEEISKIVAAYDEVDVQSKRFTLFDFMNNTIGNNLWIKYYKQKEVRYFIENYVHLGGSHYQFNYITDLKELYPEGDNFFDICEDRKLKHEYERIEAILDSRFKELMK